MRTCEECIFFEKERNGDYKDTLCSHPFIDTGYVDAKQEACEEWTRWITEPWRCRTNCLKSA